MGWKPVSSHKPAPNYTDRGTYEYTTCPELQHDNVTAGSQTCDLSITSPMPQPLHCLSVDNTIVADTISLQLMQHVNY